MAGFRSLLLSQDGRNPTGGSGVSLTLEFDVTNLNNGPITRRTRVTATWDNGRSASVIKLKKKIYNGTKDIFK